MAIHPARFSGRIAFTKPARPVRHPTLLGKVLKIVLFLALVAVLAQLSRYGFAALEKLPNLPNQTAYPIEVKTYNRTNLVLVGLADNEVGYLAVVSLADGEKVKFLPLPVVLSGNLARGRGFYSLNQAWKLGNLDDNSGIRLLRDSVSRFLAVPIDGYLAMEVADWNKLAVKFGATPEAVEQTLASPGIFLKFTDPKPWGSRLYGSLSGWQIYPLLLRARGEGEVKTLDASPALSTANSEDGLIYTLDTTALDSRLGPEFQEKEVLKSHPRVSIVNASGLSGAGSELARYVRNLGGEVISLESTDTHTKTSTIVDHIGSSLSQRLGPLISAQIKADTKAARADLEIVIGESAIGIF